MFNKISIAIQIYDFFIYQKITIITKYFLNFPRFPYNFVNYHF